VGGFLESKKGRQKFSKQQFKGKGGIIRKINQEISGTQLVMNAPNTLLIS